METIKKWEFFEGDGMSLFQIAGFELFFKIGKVSHPANSQYIAVGQGLVHLHVRAFKKTETYSKE
jgi:hypothetical protein